MNIEYYHRISLGYSPGDSRIENDELITERLNNKIDTWASFVKKTSKNFQYRITNTDHFILPAASFGPGLPSVMICINIAYTV